MGSIRDANRVKTSVDYYKYSNVSRIHSYRTHFSHEIQKSFEKIFGELFF